MSVFLDWEKIHIRDFLFFGIHARCTGQDEFWK